MTTGKQIGQRTQMALRPDCLTLKSIFPLTEIVSITTKVASKTVRPNRFKGRNKIPKGYSELS